MSKTKFKIRSAGVALEQNHVFLYRSIDSDYWALPGGQINHGESSDQALVREVSEELGAAVEIGRLVWLIENIYPKNGKIIHELGFYYYMHFIDELNFGIRSDELTGYEKNRKLIFKWHPIQELEDLVLYPAFLKTGLRDIPTSVQHIVSMPGKDVIY